jgi:spermidine synthase
VILSKKNKRQIMKNINTILNEMITHIPLCTHQNPQDVIIVNSNEEIKKQLSNYKLNSSKELDFDALLSSEFNSIDVIILNQKSSLDTQSIASIYKILKDDGIVVFISDDFDDENSNLSDNLKLMSDFWVAMPSRFEAQTLILASKKYHPQADIVLQRANFIDDLYYYHSDIQISSFTMPTYIKKALLGIAKN